MKAGRLVFSSSATSGEQMGELKEDRGDGREIGDG
jgi:hypothetical protein